MKKAAIVFVLMTLSALTILPIINLTVTGFKTTGDKSWWRKQSLYSFDVILPVLSRIMYPLGISILPDQVVVGKDGWLLLGDHYGRNLSRLRSGPLPEDSQMIEQISIAARQWQSWMQAHGVQVFKYMIAPNKESIYPEYLPDWAHPASVSFLDHLIAADDQGVFFDGRPALRALKSEYDQLIYYPYDSHWNIVGAAAFFLSFMENLQQSSENSGLTVLQRNQLTPVERTFDHGSDLAVMLKLNDVVRHREIGIDIDIGRKIDIVASDYSSGEILLSGDNPPLPAPFTPALVKSENALNHKKVLWLRDSFGVMMSPFMAATFTETLQLHHNALTPEILAHLVSVFQPDYVFVTVVERDSLHSVFSMQLPDETMK